MGNDSVLGKEESIKLEMPISISKPKVIAPQTGAGFILNKGDILEVVDRDGEQVADLFCFAKDDPTDSLSSGRSIDYEDTILFSTGHILYGNSGKPMLKIISDTCGRHDFLVTPCSLQMFQMISQSDAYHRSCLENLTHAFAPFPIQPHAIGTTFNIFMNVTFTLNGRIMVEAPLSKSGDSIQLEAMMPLYVGLTACSDEASNNGRCKAIEFRINSQSV